MLLEHLPSELLFEIFSYLHPLELHLLFLPISNSRLLSLISQTDLSLDLTYISLSRFLLILTTCSPSQIIFLRLTNQYSHGLLIADFFASNSFHPKQFLRLRSLHLDDIIGNEIDCLPPNLEKLYVKFHKKAEYASKFYQLALQSTSVKQCYLIGGYAFDTRTCSHISSPTIECLHMAIKSFPNDLIVLLQALPSLTKLKTRIYMQSSVTDLSSSFSSPLTHLNIDLQGSGISLATLESQLLSYLPLLQSLIYHSYGKSTEDVQYLMQLSTQFRRIQFIQKGLLINTDITQHDFNNNLISIVQEITNNKNSRRSLALHTIPYPDKMLHLPFVQWNQISSSDGNHRQVEEIYDRVERVRINLCETSIPSNFPSCRHVKHLTLIAPNDTYRSIMSPEQISTLVHLPSIRHLVVNTTTSLFNFNHLFPLMSLHSLDIAWCQLRVHHPLSNIKILSLNSVCVSSGEILYLIDSFIPQLEHLKMNVTTSDECREILDFLLSPMYENKLISIRVCICQTLSDQIKQDLEPILLSSQWVKVKWRMDNWYLYIWKL